MASGRNGPQTHSRAAKLRAASSAARRSFGRNHVAHGRLSCPQTNQAQLGGLWNKERTREWIWTKSKTSDRWKNKREERIERQPKWQTTLGARHTWAEKYGALKQLGDDSANFKLAKYGWSAESGYSYDPREKSHEFNIIKAQVGVAAAAAEAKAEGRYTAGSVGAEVFSASAEASMGGEWSKKAKELHVKAGGSIDLVRGEVSGDLKIPLWGDHQITIGFGAEGQIGASAEFDAHAGWTEKKEFQMGVSAKAGTGIGAGLDFNLGIQ